MSDEKKEEKGQKQSNISNNHGAKDLPFFFEEVAFQTEMYVVIEGFCSEQDVFLYNKMVLVSTFDQNKNKKWCKVI